MKTEYEYPGGTVKRVSGRRWEVYTPNNKPVGSYTTRKLALEEVSSIYCLKCHRKVKPDPPISYEVLANGREAIVGICPYCGTVIYKIIG